MPRTRQGASLASLCVAAWLAFGAAGCSLFFVQGPPPEDQRSHHFDCTTKMALPVFDGVLAAVQVIATALVASHATFGSAPVTLVGAPLAGAWIGSGVYGSRQVNACREALEDRGDRRVPLSPAREEEAAVAARVRAMQAAQGQAAGEAGSRAASSAHGPSGPPSAAPPAAPTAPAAP